MRWCGGCIHGLLAERGMCPLEELTRFRTLAPAGLIIPRLPRSALQMAVAIVGAGIMPANFYLHSALVHSR